MDASELADRQAESGVIGTLLFHPEYVAFSDYLSPKYFSERNNGIMYWAIKELFNSGIKTITDLALAEKIRNNRDAQRVMEEFNLPGVKELIEYYKMTAGNSLEEYKMFAQTVTSYAYKRDMSRAIDKLQSQCFNQNMSMQELSNEAYKEIDGLTTKYVTASGDVAMLGEEIDSIWEDIVSRRSEDGTYGIPSKYPAFKEYFTYQPGELYVVQARYKQGKSVFLMNEVVHMLRGGIACLVVDSEMTTRLYTERLLAHLTGIPVGKIQSGLYSEEEESKIKEQIQWIKSQPFVHIYDPYMTMEKLYSICKMLQNKIGLGFLCYDYLKSNKDTTGENYNYLGAMADYLKNNIAGDLDIPVLAACQLNKQGEVADSDKINRYLSVGIKWGYKTFEQKMQDGGDEFGNCYAKIYVNRLGKRTDDSIEDDYIDFNFIGDTMTIKEAQQHVRSIDI